MIHDESNAVILTDAPKDNQGQGEFFSPTDLVGAALASCILTTIAIGTKTYDLDLTGMKATIEKTMSDDKPRRIIKLELSIYLPLKNDHPQRLWIEKIARNCPVHHSLHPDLEQDIRFIWI
jgi:uncharacterized OsmC-like protein